jgi:hypothetical protein
MNINIENVNDSKNKYVKKFSSIFGIFLANNLKSPAMIRSEETEILDIVKHAKNEWLDASRSFEQVHDEELVDYFTYKMKACELRYAYFLKKAKEMGIKSIEIDRPTHNENINSNINT